MGSSSKSQNNEDRGRLLRWEQQQQQQQSKAVQAADFVPAVLSRCTEEVPVQTCTDHPGTKGWVTRQETSDEATSWEPQTRFHSFLLWVQERKPSCDPTICTQQLGDSEPSVHGEEKQARLKTQQLVKSEAPRQFCCEVETYWKFPQVSVLQHLNQTSATDGSRQICALYGY